MKFYLSEIYNSLHQPLDGWALDELVGHYVNYRKQISPSLEELLPVEDFCLYAVSTRHPEKLAAQASLNPTKNGVYEAPWGSRRIHLIVLSEVARVERNAVWQLFSGQRERVRYGASHLKLQLSIKTCMVSPNYYIYCPFDSFVILGIIIQWKNREKVT